MAMEVDDELSLTFAALADPTRRAILARLATGQATVNELAEPFDMSLQAISKHLKVLERAGLITRGRDAQFRPCRFEAAPLDVAVEWIGRYRQIWTDRFDQLEVHLRQIQAGQTRATAPQRPAPRPPAAPQPQEEPT
jgi:DNA-binding transcriptional ArsR family regulator